MDGEADAFELRRVLDEAKGDAELREQWHRLHLIRDVMQRNLGDYDLKLRDELRGKLADPNLEVEEILEEAPASSDRTGGRGTPLLGRLAGGAIAAAVAVLVLVNGGVFDEDAATLPNHDLAQQLPSGGVDQSGLVNVMYGQATDADIERHNGLMIYHLQQRAMNRSGIASFVKVATFKSSDGGPVPQDEDSAEAISDPQ